MELNLNFLLKATCLLIMALSFAIPKNSLAQVKSEIFYQCAPCGCSSDEKKFKHSGDCPACGMELNERTEPYGVVKSLDEPMNVAILLYAHVEVLDYAGPYDVFANAGEENFNIYTVAETASPVITFPNLSVNPQYTIANCPKPDILIIPGGMTSNVSQKTKNWIKENSKDADYVFSVCTGAFILAEIGILDGLEATTHSSGLSRLENKFTAINKVHSDKRYVDNGKVITSGGVSAGIDASFYLISKILGEVNARAVANAIEYIYWNPVE